MRIRIAVTAAVLGSVLFAPRGHAQLGPNDKILTQPQRQSSQTNGQKPESTASASTEEQEPQNGGAFRQRLFYIIPDFWAQNLDANIRPLSKQQKFELFVRTTIDRSTLLGAAFSAGIDQASDSPERFDQNFGGYAQRYGLIMAGTGVSNGLKLAALPIVFRQDPRYFRLDRGSGMRRTFYAFSRVAVARSDDGRSVFNWSELLGSFSTAAIANAWHEDKDRTFANTMSRGAISIGFDAGFNVLKEFWPELKRRLGTGAKPPEQDENAMKDGQSLMRTEREPQR